MVEPKERIRQLNDRLRCEHRGGIVVMTEGVRSRGASFICALDLALSAVTFDPANDPYEEHDFASLHCKGEAVFFKIDYYDLAGRRASPDPADDSVTLRVMTIMLAEEY